MKRASFSSLLVLSVLIATVALAQQIRVDDMLVGGMPKHYLASAGDSAKFDIPYVGDRLPLLRGQLPDSIKISTWCNSDTLVLDIDVAVSVGGSAYAYSYYDSVQAGAWQTHGVISGTVLGWGSGDILKVAAKQRATGASVVPANAKAAVRVERYFTIPAK